MPVTESAIQAVYHPLPALLVAWPLVCALFVYPLGRWSESVRNGFMAFVTATTLLAAAALVPLVASEHVVGTRVPMLLGDLVFAVDSYAMLFAIFTAFLWFAATLYSLDYLKHEHQRDRFHTTSLVVLAAMLGVVLAGDLVTLYLFFEALGLTAFLFVIHTETDKAKRAAVKYLWMTVVGGLMLIAGIFLTYAIGGNGSLLPLPLEEATETLKWVTFGLLVLGFGVKAGMLPVHVWLPDAHPVAPSPASALLSGVMIKAGAYGIFRTACALFRPPVAGEVEEALWEATAGFGLVILWIGIATMAIGVIMALGQSNSKRMLAYHSISQMGFILAGIGAAAYLGTEGALGVAGGLYHVVNHALFKGALFLGVGAVAFRTGELDMYKLGGLWKRMPLTFVLTLIAAAGITGVPLFNGFVSKCLIHHSLVEAFEFQHLASLGIAERIYVVTCGGTACSFIKLIGFTFLVKPKREYGPEVVDAPPRMLVAMGMLGAAIIALGIWPQIVLEGVIAPGLHTWGLSSELIEKYLNTMFLSPADLMSFVLAFAIGVVIFVVGIKFGLFHLRAPAWFGVNYWYEAGARGFVRGCGAVQKWYEDYLAWLVRSGRAIYAHARRAWRYVQRRWRRLVVEPASGTPASRNERFLRTSVLALARERQTCVRAAVDAAALAPQVAGEANVGRRAAVLAAARELAGFQAERLYAHRMEVLRDFANANEIDSVRESFPGILVDARRSCASVTSVSLDLLDRHLSGEDVTDELAVATGGIVREEDFPRMLRDSAAPARPLTFAERRAAGASLVEIMVGWVSDAVPDWRATGTGTVEIMTGSVMYVVHILVEASTQEHSELFSPRHDAETVVRTRGLIQRYARDMSLNVAVILVVMLILLASILAKT